MQTQTTSPASNPRRPINTAYSGGADLTPTEIKYLYNNLHNLKPDEQAEVLKIVEELEERKRVQACRDDLIRFCIAMQDDYKVGKHHKILADLLMQVAEGKKDRICVNIPPRHGKSQLVSIYFPAWFLGKYPNKKVLMVSHTTDLAVDFGRKVRNLIDTDAYRRIFPTLGLAQDSKSAGRWNTNAGGEYYACLRRYALVHTTRGYVPAGQIQVGDRLLNAGTPVSVLEIYDSTHAKTFRVAGLDCSGNHPIWTMNRGWIRADGLSPKDILRVESISDSMKALLWRLYGYLEHSVVPSLVQHESPLRTAKQRSVPFVRGTWDFCMRAVAGVQKLLAGHGAAPVSPAYDWKNRQRWALQSGELPVGGPYSAGQQQTHQRAGWREDLGGKRPGTWDSPRNDPISTGAWTRPSGPDETTQEELWAYSPPENLGWLARAGTYLLVQSGKNNSAGASGSSPKGNLACIGETAQKLCGFLLGVRRVGQIAVVGNTSAPFVNFLTDGDHTFFADGVLTHNCGIGSALAGRGADLLLVDDPHSEQDVLNGNFEVFEKAYEWFTYGARTRLMPGGRIALVQTRWHMDDLTGRVVKDMVQNDMADQYEVVEFPAILEVENPETGEIRQRSLWPEWMPLEALLKTKASMPVFQWNAQYQQQPTAEEAAIVKREWWQWWGSETPPDCEFKIMSLDAAAEKNNRADFTAITTWGVFNQYDDDGRATANLILLNSIKKRVEFPELKELALREYKFWAPDAFIVEKKSSGTPLYQELRRMGLPVGEFTPHRGTGDKLARLNSVADIIRSGLVWVPETRWAEELVEEVAGFPFMSHDDLVDSMVMALLRFRQGGFLRLDSDEIDDPRRFHRKRTSYY